MDLHRRCGLPFQPRSDTRERAESRTLFYSYKTQTGACWKLSAVAGSQARGDKGGAESGGEEEKQLDAPPETNMSSEKLQTPAIGRLEGGINEGGEEERRANHGLRFKNLRLLLWRRRILTEILMQWGLKGLQHNLE